MIISFESCIRALLVLEVSVCFRIRHPAARQVSTFAGTVPAAPLAALLLAQFSESALVGITNKGVAELEQAFIGELFANPVKTAFELASGLVHIIWTQSSLYTFCLGHSYFVQQLTLRPRLFTSMTTV